MMDDKFYTIEEISKTLKLTVSTIRKHVYKRELEFYRFGKHLRFTEKNVNDFIEKNKNKVKKIG